MAVNENVGAYLPLIDDSYYVQNLNDFNYIKIYIQERKIVAFFV